MHTHSDAALFWIGLSSIPGIGRTTFRKIVRRFGSPEKVLAAPEGTLTKSEGLSEKAAHGIRTFPWKEYAEQELARARDAGVAIITLEDPAYPERLRNTSDPPLYFYAKGNVSLLNEQAVAIVGTRTPTYYGLSVTHRIAYGLAAAGLTVVSGMARGIDTQAHKGALAARGSTIAVLACGIDVAYPPENKGLMEQISDSGTVVTENPFGTKPESGYFPARNRIISGLSLGTVIIEAAEDSGSLITAAYALKEGRRLFAVPGNIGSPNSRGTNTLIKEGAVLVEETGDILGALAVQSRPVRATTPPRPTARLTAEEETIFRCISGEPKHIDRIIVESDTAPGKISGLLITLELKGMVKQLPGKYFVSDG